MPPQQEATVKVKQQVEAFQKGGEPHIPPNKVTRKSF